MARSQMLTKNYLHPSQILLFSLGYAYSIPAFHDLWNNVMEPNYIVGHWPLWSLRSLKLLSRYLTSSTPVMNQRFYALLPRLIIAYLFPHDTGYCLNLKLSSPVLFASRLVAQILGHIFSEVASICGRTKRQPKDKITNENSYLTLQLEFTYNSKTTWKRAVALYHTDRKVTWINE